MSKKDLTVTFLFISIVAIIPLLFSFFSSSKRLAWNRKTKPNSIRVVGNIHDVLSGNIREDNLVELKPTDFSCGLGCGTFDKLEELGEAIMFDNKIYIKSTSEEKNYRIESSIIHHDDDSNNSNISSKSSPYNLLMTPWSVGITPKSVHMEELEVTESSGSSNQTLSELFQDLLPLFDNQCFGVYGRATFSSIYTLAIKKSPMYGMDLMVAENRPLYFHEMYHGEDVEAIFVGVVIKKDNVFFRNFHHISKKLFHYVYVEKEEEEDGKFFLKNELGDDDVLMTHTHVAFIDYKKEEEEEDQKENNNNYFDTKNIEVIDVQHLYSKSRIEKGRIRIFDIKELIE